MKKWTSTVSVASNEVTIPRGEIVDDDASSSEQTSTPSFTIISSEDVPGQFTNIEQVVNVTVEKKSHNKQEDVDAGDNDEVPNPNTTENRSSSVMNDVCGENETVSREEADTDEKINISGQNSLEEVAKNEKLFENISEGSHEETDEGTERKAISIVNEDVLQDIDAPFFYNHPKRGVDDNTDQKIREGNHEEASRIDSTDQHSDIDSIDVKHDSAEDLPKPDIYGELLEGETNQELDDVSTSNKSSVTSDADIHNNGNPKVHHSELELKTGSHVNRATVDKLQYTKDKFICAVSPGLQVKILNILRFIRRGKRPLAKQLMCYWNVKYGVFSMEKLYELLEISSPRSFVEKKDSEDENKEAVKDWEEFMSVLGKKISRKNNPEESGKNEKLLNYSDPNPGSAATKNDEKKLKRTRDLIEENDLAVSEKYWKQMHTGKVVKLPRSGQYSRFRSMINVADQNM